MYCAVLKVQKHLHNKSGGNNGEVTPVPIPNTEVKLSSADGTWTAGPGRVSRRRVNKEAVEILLLLLFCGTLPCLYNELKYT